MGTGPASAVPHELVPQGLNTNLGPDGDDRLLRTRPPGRSPQATTPTPLICDILRMFNRNKEKAVIHLHLLSPGPLSLLISGKILYTEASCFSLVSSNQRTALPLPVFRRI